jgi:hypothetical protein
MKSEMILVYYTTGCYDDFTRITIFVTEDEELAKRYVEKFNRILKYWKDYWYTIVNEDNWLEDDEYDFIRWNQVTETNQAYFEKIEVRK